MRVSKFNRRKALTALSTLAMGSSLGALAPHAMAQNAEVAKASPPPPSQPSAPPPVEAFAKSAAISHICISPDGKRVAYVTTVGDNAYIIHTILAEQKSAKIGLGKVKARGLIFADNAHLVVQISSTIILPGRVNKEELHQGLLIGLDSGKARTLFDNVDRFYPIVYEVYRARQADGTYRIIATNYAEAETRLASTPMMANASNNIIDYAKYAYSFDPENYSPRQIIHGNVGITGDRITMSTERFVFTKAGHPAALSDFEDANGIWSVSLNLANPGHSSDFNTVYVVKNIDNLSKRPSLIGLGTSEQSVVVQLKLDDGGYEYYEIGRDGKPVMLDTDHRGEDRSPSFHPVTGLLSGFIRRGDWFTRDYSDPLLKKIAEAIPNMVDEGALWTIADYSEDPRKLILYIETHDDPGFYVYLDMTTGQTIPIGVNYPDLPNEWMSQKAAIDYKAADGLNIHAFLTLPPNKNAKNLPLVVMPHGGPKVRDHIDYDWQAAALAARGYAVLQPNYRGSAGYGLAFMEAGYGEWGRKMQTDLSDGVRHLVKQGLVDPKRVAIYGASYGGYAALAGALFDPGVYCCAIDVEGPTSLREMINFVSNFGGRQSSIVTYWKEMFGPDSRWDEISPLKQAAKASCPIMIIHGEDDTVVPVYQSREMESALKASGKPVELFTYKGQDHWETIESARIDMIRRVVGFLDKHNPA